MVEDESSHEAYLRGRLLGLNELVIILKDAMETGETGAIVRSIVDHISAEMDSIIDDLKEAHGSSHPVLRAAESKVAAFVRETKGEEPEVALQKQIATADVLLKNLMALQKKAVEGKE
ncbi:MAG: hypothetical protein NTY90_03295 [Candidatus Micrarchaeota archaeon]|nr:hypothetical protein [Candidatus Micrarchaeota archaeon]